MGFRFPQRLYPIVDSVRLAEAVLTAGCRLLQLRLKAQPTGAVVAVARTVQDLAARAGARLIINDRADIARLVGAAGVHLGQDDLPAAVGRELLGPAAVIGVSTHTPAQLEAAVRAGGADYLAFGPIYPTRSKDHPDPAQGLDGLRAARARCPLPLVAIGGITAATLPDVLAAGADAVAVIAAIAHAEDPAAAARDLLGRSAF